MLPAVEHRQVRRADPGQPAHDFQAQPAATADLAVARTDRQRVVSVHETLFSPTLTDAPGSDSGVERLSGEVAPSYLSVH